MGSSRSAKKDRKTHHDGGGQDEAEDSDDDEGQPELVELLFVEGGHFLQDSFFVWGHDFSYTGCQLVGTPGWGTFWVMVALLMSLAKPSICSLEASTSRGQPLGRASS